MPAVPRRRSRPARSEEIAAFTSLVLGLSAAVGGMAGTMGLITSRPIAWLLLPTLVLLVGLLMAARREAAWAGVAIWTLILFQAHGEAILGPLLMIVACAAVAIGPERLMQLVAHDFAGRQSADEPAGTDWIEEVSDSAR